MSCDVCHAKPSDVNAYEKEIRSAPEYQLIRVYEGGKQTEKHWQVIPKVGEPKRVSLIDGVWAKYDVAKPKIEQDIQPVVKGASDAKENPIITVLTHPDREEVVTIVTLPGYQARYTKVVTVQVPALEDGTTTCRVTHEKNYIGNKNQGYGSWTEYTEVQE